MGHDLHSWWIFHIYLSLLEGILHVRLLKKLNVIWFKDQNQIVRILNDETDVYCVYMICICIIYILYHIISYCFSYPIKPPLFVAYSKHPRTISKISWIKLKVTNHSVAKFENQGPSQILPRFCPDFLPLWRNTTFLRRGAPPRAPATFPPEPRGSPCRRSGWRWDPWSAPWWPGGSGMAGDVKITCLTSIESDICKLQKK